MSEILVVFASSHGQTQRIADTIATHLRRRGHAVELADAIAGPPPTPLDYDAVVIGSRIHTGGHAPEIMEYVIRNRVELRAMPTGFFSVSMAAAAPQAGADPQGYLETAFASANWRPGRAVAFAGGLPYRKYGRLLRFGMKMVSRRMGRTTDTSRNHDFTDWTAVEAFANQLAVDIEAAAMANQDEPTTTVPLPGGPPP